MLCIKYIYLIYNTIGIVYYNSKNKKVLIFQSIPFYLISMVDTSRRSNPHDHLYIYFFTLLNIETASALVILPLALIVLSSYTFKYPSTDDIAQASVYFPFLNPFNLPFIYPTFTAIHISE